VLDVLAIVPAEAVVGVCADDETVRLMPASSLPF
jgi:hypothetical protein